MQQVYTNENRILAMNTRNILENAGINVTIKNEHCSDGSMTGHNVYLELWVEEQDFQKAEELLAKQNNAKQGNTENWACDSCGEENSAEFQICWKCQNALSA